MEDKLRRYIEDLFDETTPTKKSIELKEEMIQNLQDKYNDLLQDGKTPEAAFNIAVAGIGDVSTLLIDIEKDAQPDEKALRKSAMLTAVAVMLYIISVLPVIIFNTIGGVRGGNFANVTNTLGIALMFLMVATATGLLIYNSMTKPKYYKESDNIVEDFREWQGDTQERKQMRKAISSALWSIIVLLYIIISFTTHAWHITWVIFLVGSAIESLINVFLSAKNRK